MSLSVNKTDTQQSYNFSFTDPFYTIHGVSRGFNLFYRETDFNKLSTVSDYQTNTKGANVTFGYPISRYQRAGMSLGYSNTVMFEGTTIPAEITDFLDTEGSRFDEYTVGFNWRYSSLNHGMFPTEGIEQRVSLSAAIPGSDLTSYKLSYRSNYYFPLASEWSVRLRTELGYGNGYGDIKRLPFFKNFRAGGLGSVRGYRTNSLGPRGLPEYRIQPLVQTNSNGSVVYETDNLGRPVVDASAPSVVYVADADGAAEAVSNSSRYKPVYATDSSGSVVSAPSFLETPRAIGGNILTEASLELIFPIPFVEDRSSVRTVAFFDAGNTFTDQCYTPSDSDLPSLTSHPYCNDGIDLGELRYSTGLGVTWVTAIGPLTFVYSIPIKDQRGDRTEGFEFSLGQSF
jgi:outer membrane protein insertion porin family